MQATTTLVQLEWKFVGSDAYRLASYWLRRHGAENDIDQLSADTVAIAYERYLAWRQKNTPPDAASMIQSFIRSASRSALAQSRMNYRGDLDSRARSDDHPDNSRLDRIISRLPVHLQAIAVRLAYYPEDSVRELGESLGLAKSTIHDRIGELKRHPAIADLALASRIGGVQ